MEQEEGEEADDEGKDEEEDELLDKTTLSSKTMRSKAKQSLEPKRNRKSFFFRYSSSWFLAACSISTEYFSRRFRALLNSLSWNLKYLAASCSLTKFSRSFTIASHSSISARSLAVTLFMSIIQMSFGSNAIKYLTHFMLRLLTA